MGHADEITLYYPPSLFLFLSSTLTLSFLSYLKECADLIYSRTHEPLSAISLRVQGLID